MTEQTASGPTSAVLVEASDHAGTVLSSVRHEVVKPLGPVRQHEQLLRAVMTDFPGARVLSATKGSVRFDCDGILVTSRYEDVLERAGVPAEAG